MSEEKETTILEDAGDGSPTSGLKQGAEDPILSSNPRIIKPRTSSKRADDLQFQIRPTKDAGLMKKRLELLKEPKSKWQEQQLAILNKYEDDM